MPRAEREAERIAPRLMTRAEAAAYCRVGVSRFSQLVRAGTLPGPVRETTRYDRVAIDAALDRLAGIMQPQHTEATSAYDRWKSEHDAHAN